jgi:hypothetical protein
VLSWKHAAVVLVLLSSATPVATAVRSVNCDLDEPDWQLGMHVRSQQCLVDTAGTHIEITIIGKQERWVLDLPQADKRTIAWSWWGGIWHRAYWDDRILWSGTAKTDQLACRFGGVSKVRYVFSNDTAICLTQ